MREAEFREWLKVQQYAATSISAWLSDIRRMEKAHGDVDAHFDRDRLAALLTELAYTKADERAEKPGPDALGPVPSLYKNLAGFRSALRYYRRFREAQAHPQGRLSGLDRHAIFAAIAACDAAGSVEAFLGQMEGFGQPQTWWLVHEGALYPSKAIVNWAMARSGITPKAGGSESKAVLDGLGFAVVDRPALLKARDAFVARMTGFTDFAQDNGAYWEIERRYKNERIAAAQVIAAGPQDDRAAGEALFRLLVPGAQGLPLSWRTQAEIDRANAVLQDRFYAALGTMARSEAGIEEAVTAAARELEALRDAGIVGLRRGEVASIPITIWGTLHPDEASWFKISKIEELGKRFFGRKLFAQAGFQEGDLAEWLLLMRTLFALLDQQFCWRPRDLFDVQGFLWVVLDAGYEQTEEAGPPAALHPTPMWIVTARYGDEDGFARFIERGEWSLLYGGEESRANQLVRQMQVGDRIVLRDYHHQVHNLPFDANGGRVSAIRLRALGTVTQASADGVRVGVDWQPWAEPRTWYFYTHGAPVWGLVDPGESPMADRLRRFILEGEPQDYDWFLSDPYWRERLFGKGLTDADILARFDRSALFREGRSGWKAEQVTAFCAIARAVHGAGLDWWFVDIARAPVRFGRKSPQRKHAEGVAGYLSASPFWLWANPRGSPALQFDEFAADAGTAESFTQMLGDQAEAIARWKAPDPARAGLWPDEGEQETEVSTIMNPTNLILYGPPGTGKTYRTAHEAVRLCGEVPAADRTQLNAQYEALRKAGRIEFVTFHQNFAYEEFVEGLRPQTGPATGGEGTGGGFRLDVEPGIFHTIATTAEQARLSAGQGPAMDLAGRRIFKMSLGRSGIDDDIFEEAWDGGYIVLGYGGEIDWSGYGDYEAIKARWNREHPGTHGASGDIAQVNRFVTTMQPGDLVIVPLGNTKIRAIGEVTGGYEFVRSEEHEYHHRRAVRWLKRFDEPLDYSVVSEIPFTQRTCYPLREENLKRAGLASLLPGEGGGMQAPQQFVLVIDEINRANISRVFGELITLIEPDKRLGMANALTVRLPYSRREFGVPANLHIVGTMNTADRSIALLDTALRRRFRFEELAPRPGLLGEVEGVPLGKVLRTINQRLEYLLDRDHAIGHAFFMGDGGRNLDAVDDTMRYKVIPLLQEYFFEDWGRIYAVLGKGFITGTPLDPPPGIPPTRDRHSWAVRPLPFGRAAYDTLLSKVVDGEDDAGTPEEEEEDALA